MKTFLKLGAALVLFGVVLSALGVGIIRSHAVTPDSKASLSASMNASMNASAPAAPSVASSATVSASAATTVSAAGVANVPENTPAAASK